MKALAKSPSERPQTPMEFLRALRPAPVSLTSEPRSRRYFGALALATGAGLLGAGLTLFASRRGRGMPAPHSGPPTVVLMDTPVAHGVYDADVLARGGTNADTLNDLLRDLPIAIEKETVPSTWNRELHVLELKPDLIVIHRSAFFHGLNVEFGFGYEPFPDETTRARWRLLYRTAEDKLIAFMGLVATVDSRTRFLVYSRGTGASVTSGDWQDAAYRREWVTSIERRFPRLAKRVTTLAIEGGVASGSFKRAEVVRQTREAVRAILGLP
jgi:hypothetical protein